MFGLDLTDTFKIEEKFRKQSDSNWECRGQCSAVCGRGPCKSWSVELRSQRI